MPSSTPPRRSSRGAAACPPSEAVLERLGVDVPELKARATKAGARCGAAEARRRGRRRSAAAPGVQVEPLLPPRRLLLQRGVLGEGLAAAVGERARRTRVALAPLQERERGALPPLSGGLHL